MTDLFVGYIAGCPRYRIGDMLLSEEEVIERLYASGLRSAEVCACLRKLKGEG